LDKHFAGGLIIDMSFPVRFKDFRCGCGILTPAIPQTNLRNGNLTPAMLLNALRTHEEVVKMDGA